MATLPIRVQGDGWRDRLLSLPSIRSLLPSRRGHRYVKSPTAKTIEICQPETRLEELIAGWGEPSSSDEQRTAAINETQSKLMQVVDGMDWDPLSVTVPLIAAVGGKDVVVLDGLVSSEQRAALLTLLIGKTNITDAPPSETWERTTSDAAGLPPTWGLQQSMLRQLESCPPRVVLEVQSRLARLFPEYDIQHMPDVEGTSSVEDEGSTSAGSSYSRTSFVANAAVYGDCFQWHVDADPLAMPRGVWSAQHGPYANGTAGKPLLVSLLVYLDAHWQKEWDAETLFLEPSSGAGLLVQPRPARAVLMHQDVLHRVSTPSMLAHRPRYSLVWKLVFLPKRGGEKPVAGGGGGDFAARETIRRPEWGTPVRIGS